MKMKILIAVSVIFLLMSCQKRKEKSIQIVHDLKFNLEKIVVVNLNEACVTYFKVKVENPNDSTIILLDNSLSEIRLKGLKPEAKGFYLKNIKNDSLVPLGIDNYFFYEVPSKKSGYVFIAASNLKNSFEQKDSLAFKASLREYSLEYNGDKLNLNAIEKSSYISQKQYDDFIQSRNKFIAYKKHTTIKIPANILPIKYLTEMPITQEDWFKL